MGASPSNEETLFAEAIARPPAERAAFLVNACGTDAALLGRLVALVAAHDEKDSLFASALGRPAAPHDEQPGGRIGRYKLLQKVGEGGCGVVWMAEQHEPVHRRVALKVIKLGMDTKAVLARFDAERQALAMMDHPNIAKVLDGGATDTGRPFFVMELVRGIPITRYCDENRLTPKARLELFINICHAVQHAHQKGIIHRDLKPSNILIALHDGVPVPKVIDFGIAKATQGRLTEQTLFTAFELFIGTPVYMSPEQAEMSGLEIDARSDIYSLGVLLYELMMGRTPFDPKAFAAAGVDQIRQQIRETEPPRPSRRLSTLGDDERTTIARLRNTGSAQLSLMLRGDLDWIVMRCIEKDRTRRYDTADAVAMDIQRYLHSEPVVARPPSTVYVLQRLIRRHRAGFAAAVAAGGVLVISLLMSARRAPDFSGPAQKPAETRASDDADEVSRLIAQARELIYEIEGARHEFALAESLLKRAGELAPGSAPVWGLSAFLNISIVRRNFETGEERFARARADAEKALRLDPDNVDALMALAKYHFLRGQRGLAKEFLERARVADPLHPKVYVELAALIPDMTERIKFRFEAARQVPDNSELLYHNSNNLRGQRRWAESFEVSDRLLAQNPSWRAYVGRAITEYMFSADPAKVLHWLDRIPELKRDEPRAVIMRFKAAILRRDGVAAEQALRAIPTGYIQDTQFTGPKAYLLAQARELSGLHTIAIEQWRLAEESLRAKLKESPDDFYSSAMLAVSLAAQRRTVEAGELLDSISGRIASIATRQTTAGFFFRPYIAHACVLLGDPSRAIANLQKSLRGELTSATLAAEPRWDPLRNHPDYPALLRAFAAVDGLAIAEEATHEEKQRGNEQRDPANPITSGSSGTPPARLQ